MSVGAGSAFRRSGAGSTSVWGWGQAAPHRGDAVLCCTLLALSSMSRCSVDAVPLDTSALSKPSKQQFSKSNKQHHLGSQCYCALIQVCVPPNPCAGTIAPQSLSPPGALVLLSCSPGRSTVYALLPSCACAAPGLGGASGCRCLPLPSRVRCSCLGWACGCRCLSMAHRYSTPAAGVPGQKDLAYQYADK